MTLRTDETVGNYYENPDAALERHTAGDTGVFDPVEHEQANAECQQRRMAGACEDVVCDVCDLVTSAMTRLPLDQQPDMHDGREPVNTEVSILRRLDNLETKDMNGELDKPFELSTTGMLPFGTHVRLRRSQFVSTIRGRCRGIKVFDMMDGDQPRIHTDTSEQYWVEGVNGECFVLRDLEVL